MSIAQIALFTLGLAIAMASPGPVVAALLARVIGRGVAGVPAFCAGLVLGDVLWFAAAMFGLAALMTTAQPLFAALKYAGAAYLLWLAWKYWTAPAVAPRDAELGAATRWHGFVGALTLTLGNPKTMVFYLALAPSLVDPVELTLARFALLTGVLVSVYAVVLTLYVTLAARARRLFQSGRAVRIMNRTAGTTMAGVAVAVAAR